MIVPHEKIETYFDVHPKGPWPATWQDSFGRYDFFYLTGVKEYFNAKGAGSAISTANMLDNLLPRKWSISLSDPWISSYPRDDGLNLESLRKKWSIAKLNREALVPIVQEEPVSFSKIFVVLHGLKENRKSAEAKELLSSIKVRLINAHVPSIDLALDEISKVHLRGIVRRLGGKPYLGLLHDLSLGFPVSYQLAERIVLSFREAESVPKDIKDELVIDWYQERMEVRNEVRSNDPTIPLTETMRVARKGASLALL